MRPQPKSSDLHLILDLMRANSDALGFIPRPALSARWISTGRYLIAHDRRHKPIGFLLHGPVHADGHAHIHQVCTDYDRRRRQHATQLLHELVTRLRREGAKTIHLRCGTDLEAMDFWTAIGAIPTLLCEGGKRRKRLIQHFELLILPKPPLQFRSCGPFGPPLDPIHLEARRPLEST